MMGEIDELDFIDPEGWSASLHRKKRRARLEKCRRGHLFTPENTVWRKSGLKRKRKCQICMEMSRQKWRQTSPKANQAITREARRWIEAWESQ